MRAVVQVEGLRESVAMLNDVGQRGRMPEPPLRSPGTLRDLLGSEQRQFAHGRFPRVQPEWAREKRRRGLDPRTARATGRVERALTGSGVGLTHSAFNGVLSFGIPRGRSDIYYAAILARRGRARRYRFVVIDREAKGAISLRVQRYVATGALL